MLPKFFLWASPRKVRNLIGYPYERVHVLGACLEFQSTNRSISDDLPINCLCWMLKVKSKSAQAERNCSSQLHFSARNAASRYTLWCICRCLWRISAPGSKGRRGVDGKVESGTWCWKCKSPPFWPLQNGRCMSHHRADIFNIKNGATLLSHCFAYSTSMIFRASLDAREI